MSTMNGDVRVALAEVRTELRGLRELFTALRVEDRNALTLAESGLKDHLEKLNGAQQEMRDLNATFYTRTEAEDDEEKRMARRESHETALRSELKVTNAEVALLKERLDSANGMLKFVAWGSGALLVAAITVMVMSLFHVIRIPTG